MKKTREILTKRIRNGIAKPFSSELIKLIKPAIRMIPEQAQSQEKTLSKFGGIPLIKKGEDWIRNQKTNNPYAFLLQLDLEEIESYDIENRLPKKGMLSIWFNLDYWDEGKIIYYPNKEELIKATVPIEFSEEEKRKALPFWKRVFTKYKNVKLYPECKIKFEVEYQTPSWDSLQISLFHLKNKTKPRDLEIDEKFIDDYCYEYKSSHHFFGYYVGLQDSPYELMRITKGRFPNKLTEELINQGLKWKLLLRLDSDSITNMNWIDGGQLLFFIKEDDLEKGNFDNLNIQLDTT